MFQRRLNSWIGQYVRLSSYVMVTHVYETLCSVLHSFVGSWHFLLFSNVSGRGGIGVEGNKSWESWWDEEQEHLKYTGIRGRIIECLLSLRFFLFQYGIVYHLHIAEVSKNLTISVCSNPPLLHFNGLRYVACKMLSCLIFRVLTSIECWNCSVWISTTESCFEFPCLCISGVVDWSPLLFLTLSGIWALMACHRGSSCNIKGLHFLPLLFFLSSLPRVFCVQKCVWYPRLFLENAETLIWWWVFVLFSFCPEFSCIFPLIPMAGRVKVLSTP